MVLPRVVAFVAGMQRWTLRHTNKVNIFVNKRMAHLVASGVPSSKSNVANSCCTPKSEANSSCCPPKVDSALCPPKAELKSCCGPLETENDNQSAPVSEVTHSDVSEYYGKTIQATTDLLTSACVLQTDELKEVRQLLKNIHPEILEKFYGCGSPIPPLLKGTTVLDLGCGTGKDVYTAAQLVGDEGRVIGVDMTEEQLAVARKHQEFHRLKFGHSKSNVEFHKAFIEDLKSIGLAEESVDVVISNCVLNLAMDKEAVLSEVFRVLKSGGELYFSDVYTDKRVPKELQKDKVLFGECLSGALYFADFRRILSKVGFSAWGVTYCRKIAVNSEEIEKKVGDINFYSLTVRAIKLPPGEGEDAPEDYGQFATYNGSIPGQSEAFKLDLGRVFPSGVSVPVDSTSAALLSFSRYISAFSVSEKKSHKGAFTGWTSLSSNAGVSLAQLEGSDVEEACCC